MNKENSKLIEKTISSLDWDSICESGKIFKFGVGEGVVAIPGMKKKNYTEEISKNEYKAELKTLLKYVVDNDISEFIYGPWVIFWFNSEWDLEIEDYEDYEEDEYDEFGEEIQIGSSIEVIYSPQRICLANVSGKVNKPNYNIEETDVNRLESMLKKAIDSENYELASKIRDVIKIHNTEPKDKKDI